MIAYWFWDEHSQLVQEKSSIHVQGQIHYPVLQIINLSDPFFGLRGPTLEGLCW